MYKEIAWYFETANFRVQLEIIASGEPYDGEDPDGEFQRRLEDGSLTMFDSVVTVIHLGTGAELAFDSLSGSVYENPSEFWRAHRDRNPMARNCEAYRAVHGANAVVCHYFPSMVRMACLQARKKLLALGAVRVRV
jgi:hypothetical protein